MKGVFENMSDDDRLSEQASKLRKCKLNEHELEELREHIDLISFNLGKVYQHARDRSRKQSMRKKFHHSYKSGNECSKS